MQEDKSLNSSLFFTKVGIIPLLLGKFKLITTEEIYKEIIEGVEIGFKDARIIRQLIDDQKIEVVKAKKTQLIVSQFHIKDTDASIISLAQELNCLLATEDRQIEKICLILNVSIVNTAVLICFLWHVEIFTDERAFMLLDILMRNGYNKEICLKIKEIIMRGDKNG